MTTTTLMQRILDDPRKTYPHGFNGVLRDRRLEDADRLLILKSWPAHDDYESAQVAAAIQGIETRQP